MTDSSCSGRGFISRWSQRKRNKKQSTEEDQPVIANLADTKLIKLEIDSLPVWQQNDVDSELKKKALNTIFRQPEFNHLDGLNDYDEDFTSFSVLGDVVTVEMRRMLRLAEAKNNSDETLPEFKSVTELKEQGQQYDIDASNEENKLV